MSIQWYPGHMTSAKKKAEEAMEFNDLVIEVLDARIPGSSTNPMIQSLRQARQRPHLKILNKSDLADPQVTAQWLNYFNQQPKTAAITLSAKDVREVKKILAVCQKLAPHRGTPVKPLRMLIMGVPNVGKSTIINALKNKRIAKVGNEPAVTKMQQRIELNDHMVLTDTPGMMWPKITNELDGIFLAASHSIGINAYDELETALTLYDTIKELYPDILAKHYKITLPFPTDEKFLEHLAGARKFILKKGELDLHKAAVTFLNDYRQGIIGRMSLESPLSRIAMLQKIYDEISPAE
ncbi:MAG: ribosome biogenesis GTPase YlqF [Methylophilales bacterium]|jgi:ribosome biogenesis GTPase A|nr:ribosome biogenesis GTPase YlqF [Methylophilales bacterium]|tara:strand:- start:1539 stop:2423 length:885 start_codon:yes stop_codon:yes gene_type:complete